MAQAQTAVVPETGDTGSADRAIPTEVRLTAPVAHSVGGGGPDPAPGVAGAAALAGQWSDDAASSVADTRRTLRITATVWSALWLPALLFALMVGWADVSHNPALGLWLFAITAAAWFACLIFRWLPVEVFAIAIFVTGLVQAANSVSGPDGVVTAAIAPWLNVGALSVALLVRPTLAVGMITTAWLAETLILLVPLVGDPAWSTAWRTDVLYPLNVLTIGMAGVVAAAGSDRVARLDDAAGADLDEAHAVSRADAARSKAEAAADRVVHDTVINTLGYVARGGAGLDPVGRDRVRERCVADLAELQRPRTGDVDRPLTPGHNAALEWLAETARRRAAVLGVDLSLTVDGSDPRGGGDLIAAASTLVGEAIVNVSKHAGVKSADLRVSGEPDSLRLSFRDHGKGCTGLQRKELARALECRVADTGARLLVESSPGAGTAITLSWTSVAAPRAGLAHPTHASEGGVAGSTLRLVARRVSAWLGLMFIYSTILGSEVAPGIGSWVGLALVAVAVLPAILVTWSGRSLPVGLAVLLVALIPPVMHFPVRELIGCARIGTWWWGGDAAMLLVIVLVLLVRVRWWWVAGACGYVISATTVLVPLRLADELCADAGAVALAGNVAVIAGVMAFRGMVERGAVETDRRRAEARRVKGEQVAERVAAAVRAERIEPVFASAGDLLTGLAGGSLDPRDEWVRRRCRNKETLLRAAIATEGAGSGLGRAILGAAHVATRRGIALHLRPMDAMPDAGMAVSAWVGGLLRLLVGKLGEGDEISITILPERTGAVITTLSRAVEQREEFGEVRAPQGASLWAADVDGELLLTMRWSK